MRRIIVFLGLLTIGQLSSAGPAVAATTCRATLIDDWVAVSFPTPSKPAQRRGVDRYGHENIAGQVGDTRNRIRLALDYRRGGDQDVAIRRVGIRQPGLTPVADPPSARAADYRFEAREQLVKITQGNRAATVEIRLVKIATGQPIADATIVASSLRMPMNGESATAASASFVANQSSGSYRFAVRAPMTGSWLLDLTAKVPGEAGVIRGSVPLYIEIEGPSRGPGHPGAPGYRDDDRRRGEER